ncbi:MAG TPA: DsbA family protein [Pseudomonadales bacterium]|nr:DsbA family protein [Pseudomonadales bacterium]
MKPAMRIRSTLMGVLASPGFVRFRRRRARLRRRLRGERPAVHYFHQVDDPYSHLVVQKLETLRSRYPIPFDVHLVGSPGPAYQGDASRYTAWARRDAGSIAEFYDVHMPAGPVSPDPAEVHRANNLLAEKLADAGFASLACDIGEKLWSGQTLPVEGSTGISLAALETGNRLRQMLGHYYGGMFYYDGEWYWGLDRVHLLEARLQTEGYGVAGDFCVPPPQAKPISGLNAGHVTLEYFPSLRSPYTAIGHQRVVDMVARTGVNLVLKPVIPMMMRGIPAPREKRLYIITDAAREARYYGVPFGRFADPIGEPVLRAFAHYPAAAAAGRGMDFVGAYLSAAFAKGIDISTPAGLARILASSGVAAETDSGDWRGILDENLQAMNDAGLWGVPSFRISDDSAAPPFSCWGQDRIWRLEIEIQRRVRQEASDAG